MLCDLGYHSSSHSSIGSNLDHAPINQLASSNSSPSSRNIVLKASVTYTAVRTLENLRETLLAFLLINFNALFNSLLY
jgi:hypothetical protein